MSCEIQYYVDKETGILIEELTPFTYCDRPCRSYYEMHCILSKLRVPQLKERCAARGMYKTGNKADLIKRLIDRELKACGLADKCQRGFKFDRGVNATHVDHYFDCDPDEEWFGPGPAALK